MQCPQCQHDNRERAKFCDECGAPMPSLCPSCNTENRPGAKFCNECGTPLTAPAPAPSLSPSSEQSITRQEQPPQPEPPTPDAERRQLTVMFCDLADSTRLSGQLDPEDLRDVIRAYQSTCAEVIERYDGYIAQHLGDGLMVYFGWPQAHEDDAQRAVHAGWGILGAMQGLNSRLEQEQDIRLAVRIGVHTGLVVVGEIGEGARQQHLALGETPNVASRIEGIAEPDTVTISDATHQLVQGYFDCEELGQHTLKGVDDAQQVYRVVGESELQSHFDVVATRDLTPLVGRELETAMLFQRWEQVKEGQGQVILLSGEAGIGKSRLLQVLRDYVADEPHTRLECHSSPYYQNTALYPITGMLQRMFQWQQDDTPQAKLDKLEQTLRQHDLALDETAELFANLMSLSIPEDRYPSLNLSPQRQRQMTLETIVTTLLQQAEKQPLLFILEDLHWTDPSTLELINLLIDQIPTAAICVLLTCRPDFQAPWSSRSYLTPIALNRLSHSQIESMVERVAGGKRLPAEVLQQIVEKTDGVPLYVEEMTKAVLESGTLKEVNGQYEPTGSLSSLSIPVSLQDSLMARLDRLVTAKGVAQYAAVIGRQFSYNLLQVVSQLNERTLQNELQRLVEVELVYQRGLPPQATYTFKHALIQDTAYQSLLKTTRQQYHQRIARVLEDRFPETTAAQPELLAHHFTEAGLSSAGAEYWYKAGQRAGEHSAYVEAISHLTEGLDVLMALTDSPERVEQELNIQIALGPLLMATRGFAASDVGSAYSRAYELCQQVGETSQLFPVLWGLWLFNHVRAEYQTALSLGEQLLSLAQRMQNPDLVLQAHHALETTLFYLGEFSPALEHMEKCLALYDPQNHHSHAFLFGGHDPGVCCLSFSALALWSLGYSDQALLRSRAALTLAEELAHPNSLAHALNRAVFLSQLRRDGEALHEQVEKLGLLTTEHDFAQMAASAKIMRGYALGMLSQETSAVRQICEGLTALQGTGTVQLQPYYLGLLAEAYWHTGQIEAGLGVVVEALHMVDTTGSTVQYKVELHRLKGELLLQLSTDNQTEAESCFHQALSIARHQQAKSWELRAATSLARLWQQQSKRQAAYDLLAPVYDWFTEGFDTADLKEAKALLNELAHAS